MSQTTDSQVVYPTIVFRVNLSSYQQIVGVAPNNTVPTGNESVSEQDNQLNTRSTMIPGFLGGESIKVKHGDTFTAKGNKATYLKKTYVSSPALHTDLLSIVSES